MKSRPRRDDCGRPPAIEFGALDITPNSAGQRAGLTRLEFRLMPPNGDEEVAARTRSGGSAAAFGACGEKSTELLVAAGQDGAARKSGAC